MTTSVSRLVEHYRLILQDRMQGLPFVNDALDVAAVGFRDFEDHRIGVLITPWFMNLVLLPGTAEWSNCEQGSVRKVAMPGDSMAFNVCHDGAVGTYLTAVLFRTVTDFPDQATAAEVAEEVLHRLFTESGSPPATSAPRISRRDLFARFGAS